MTAGDKNTDQIIRGFFDEYGKMLYGYLCKLSGSADTAEDLLQEVFLSAWKYYKPDVENPKAWLFRIAINSFNAHLRKSKRIETTHWLEDKTAGGNDFTEQVEVALFQEQLIQQLHKYKPVLAQVFFLRVEQEKTNDEIATELGISSRTVTRHLDKIRSILEKTGQAPKFLSAPVALWLSLLLKAFHE